MELFTATGKMKKSFFWQLEIFFVYTTGDTAHIDTIFKFLPHTRQHQLTRVWQELEYPLMCAVSPVVHTSNISSCQKNFFQFSCSCEQLHYGRSFGFLLMNFCNHGEHYETPCRIVYSLSLNENSFLHTFLCYWLPFTESINVFYIWVSVHHKSIIYNKSTRCYSGSTVFINNYKYALHVSDALFLHHQEHYNF